MRSGFLVAAAGLLVACTSDQQGAPIDLATIPSDFAREQHNHDFGAARLTLDLAMPPDLARPLDGLVDGGGGLGYRDLNHLLCTGQSLSVGAVGSPALTSVQPYHNRMFNTGVLAGGVGLRGFLPLVEIGTETGWAGLANYATKMAREELFAGLPAPMNTHDMVVSCHGIGGTPYAGLKKGTAAYAAGLSQVGSAAVAAARLGLSYVVRGITNVHGENDHLAGNMNYDKDLLQWQSDYESDVRAISGQREPVPMFHTQMSSWTILGSAQSAIPALQMAASDARPDVLILVGPKYQIPYAHDGLHLDNQGYRWMGEYYARAYRKVVLEGKPWAPLRPIAATLVGSEVTITFSVPAPPLVIDTKLVTDPGHSGFEFTDDSGRPPAVASVNLVDQDKVKVTLATPPLGITKRIRYAWTGTRGAHAGPTTGARGNLRDSEPATSPSGNTLYNWCVHFDLPVK